MTVSVLQERSDLGAASSTTVVLQFTSPVTPGSSFHVVVKSTDSPTSITCADNINGAHTAIGSLISDASGHRGQQFKLDNTGAGTPTVTATFSGSVTNRAILIREIGGTAGYDVQASQQQNGTINSPDGIDSGLATPSVQPGLVSGAAIIHSGSAVITGAGSGGQVLDVHPLTNWGFTDSASEHFRYTDLTARFASFAIGAGGSPNAMIFAAFFKEVAGISQGNVQAMSPGIIGPC